MLDLDAYFARIGFTGTAPPTLATLNAIVRAHVQTIPFENLDVLLGRRIHLELPAIAEKLVHDRRGGYCFEQNALLLAVLERLGFHARPIGARVRWQRPRDYLPARTHLLVRVELDGVTWLADVGVGGLSPTAVLRLDTEEEQPTPHEPRRLVRHDGTLFHQVRFPDGWHDVYELSLDEMPPIDREVANWFTSTHPDSHFRQRVFVARATPDGGRLTLLNREFTERDRSGEAKTRELRSEAELLAALAEHFGLHLPEGSRLSCAGLDWPA